MTCLIFTNKFIVKLRQYIRTFLKQVSSMFQASIYTMDLKYEYFKKSRIISRDDIKEKRVKSLDLELAQERGTLVLDDTETVWTEHKDS